MSTFNLNNKRFYLITNSDNGTVTSDTVFEYNQDGNLVTAEYHGGTIRSGKIIAIHHGDYLDMRYQCLTTDDQLKTGKAIAKITELDNGKLKLNLNWKWLDDTNNGGTSQYLED